MTSMVPIALFGWLPAAVGLFKRFQPHRAAIVGFLLAWLFLPWYTYSVPGLPDYNKISAIGLGLLIGIFAGDPTAWSRVRLHPVDIPMMLWCLIPCASSLSNGLGPYDGISEVLGRVVCWGIPYLIGRIYFTSPDHMRELMIGIFFAGLVYIPFCVYEMIMSPQIHKMVYGFHSNTTFGQNKRLGGWRPVVFMQHGIMLGLWMATATLAGLRLMRIGAAAAPASRWRFLLWAASLVLLLVTVMCKASGALALLALGLAVMETGALFRSRIPHYILIILPILYCYGRASGNWDGAELIAASSAVSSDQERVGSVAFRLDNETILVAKAMEQPLLGWGGWKRSFVRDESGETVSVPDGLWVITVGQNGILGLIALGMVLLLPQLLMLAVWTPHAWRSPGPGAVHLAAVLLGIFTVDCLLNDMFNPLLVAVAGGLSGIFIHRNIHGQNPDQSLDAVLPVAGDTDPEPGGRRLL